MNKRKTQKDPHPISSLLRWEQGTRVGWVKCPGVHTYSRRSCFWQKNKNPGWSCLLVSQRKAPGRVRTPPDFNYIWEVQSRKQVLAVGFVVSQAKAILGLHLQRQSPSPFSCLYYLWQRDWISSYNTKDSHAPEPEVGQQKGTHQRCFSPSPSSVSLKQMSLFPPYLHGAQLHSWRMVNHSDKWYLACLIREL